MTPQRLREMVGAATRAPFGWIDYFGEGLIELQAQQDLARLAPELARLCAEQHEALAELYEQASSSWDEDDIREENSYAQHGGVIRAKTLWKARGVLGRFAALGEPASGEEEA